MECKEVCGIVLDDSSKCSTNTKGPLRYRMAEKWLQIKISIITIGRFGVTKTANRSSLTKISNMMCHIISTVRK